MEQREQWDWATLGNDIGVLARNEDEPFCRLRTSEDTYDQALKRARLIAAAPELLEALQNIVTSYEAFDVEAIDMQAARDALSKATS